MTFLIQQTLIYAVPLMIVALAGVFAERSGIINLALEGIMVFGAFIGVWFVRILQTSDAILSLKQSGNWVALQGVELLTMLVAAAFGALFSLLLSFASINLRADQTIGGTALNQFAPAFAVVMTWAIQGQGLTTIFIPNWVRITRDTFGLAPVDGPSFWNNLIFKYFYLTTPVAIVLFIAAYIVMYKTRFGLRLRACGEHPQAADSVGINVYKMRYAGVLLSGALGAIGGMAYIVPPVQTWNFEVGVAGAGFLALAVMIFGQWKPFNICAAAMFFAVFKSLANIADSTFLAQLHWSSNIYNMMPFIASMIILAFTSKNSMAPKAEGIPYDKGSR